MVRLSAIFRDWLPMARESSPPNRFFLWVDAVGGYWVCLGDAVVIGRPAAGGDTDVPILGDLAQRHASLPRELSGGEQQRVAIARALIHDPRIIVCDEPTSALDHGTRHQVMEMLRSVAMHGGRTLVIVTHDARIFEFADRIAQMDDGVIHKITNSPDLTRN